MSSSMLEQAIIDAKELKESAQRNAEETIVEKYQNEIKEAVEKILEQDDLGLGGDLGADMGTGTAGTPESIDQPEAGKDQIDMVLKQLPFVQVTGDNEFIELNLGKLEESLNIVNEDKEGDLRNELDTLKEIELDEDLLDEYMLDEEFELDEINFGKELDNFVDKLKKAEAEDERKRGRDIPRRGGDPRIDMERARKKRERDDRLDRTPGFPLPKGGFANPNLEEEFELDEEMLEEDELDELIVMGKKGKVEMTPDEAKQEGYLEELSLEEMIAEALEEMLGEEDVLEEDEDLFEVEDLEEDEIKNPGKYIDGPRAKAGADDDGDGVPNKADKDPKDGAVKESKKLQKENKTLIKEQTRMSSKVQLLENKLDKYGTVIDQLKQKLDETNLTSARLLYQNRVLDSVSLNERQKNRIVEAIKDAETVEEAKIIFETLQSTVETIGKSGRKRESLDEVVYRGSSAFMPLKEDKQKVSDPFVARMKTLAGLK